MKCCCEKFSYVFHRLRRRLRVVGGCRAALDAWIIEREGLSAIAVDDLSRATFFKLAASSRFRLRQVERRLEEGGIEDVGCIGVGKELDVSTGMAEALDIRLAWRD